MPDVSKRKRASKHSARVKYGVVLFRASHNYTEREPNGCENCHPYQWHFAELDGMKVGDDLLYLEVPLLDVTPGRGCSIRSWPSSSLTGVECT
jgi:hypothetical protein